MKIWQSMVKLPDRIYGETSGARMPYCHILNSWATTTRAKFLMLFSVAWERFVGISADASYSFEKTVRGKFLWYSWLVYISGRRMHACYPTILIVERIA